MVAQKQTHKMDWHTSHNRRMHQLVFVYEVTYPEKNDTKIMAILGQ